MTRARIYSQSGVGGNVTSNVAANVTLATLIPFLTTSNVTELANLYFTNARVFANLQLASIDDLRDVNVSVKSNAQALLWDSSTNVWYAGNVATTITLGTLSPFLTTANVTESDSKDVNNGLNIKVKIDTDFAKLQYVYVVINMLSTEQLNLEAQNKVE